MTEGQDPIIGTVIGGKYKIIQLLGEGGMGCVYMGEQQLGTSTRKVAVKTLHKHLSMDPQIRARFMREVSTVAELEHPNTIQVFDFGTTTDDVLYIVMEFVQGRSLADILEKDGPMDATRALHVLQQIVGSLEEAHGRGIIHRDLKPENVVLTEKAGKKDWVEVLDFGIAKRSSETDPNEAKLTQAGMVIGTPPYMSPEQFTGQPVTARSDIYSLGIMTYEMLTGKLPFKANTAWEWASQHMTAAPESFDFHPQAQLLPSALRAAVMRCLEKNPDARFATVTEFYDAIKSGASAMGAAPISAGAMATAGGPPATAGMAAAGGYGPPPGSGGGGGGGGGRPKTEIASPMEMPPGMAAGGYGPPPGAGMGAPGGPPPGAGYGPGPAMGPGPGMGAPPHAAPANIPHAGPRPAQKKSSMGLFIGIGVGVLVLGGGGLAVALGMSGGGSKESSSGGTTATTLSATTSAPTATAEPTASASAPPPADDNSGGLSGLSTAKTPTYVPPAGGTAKPKSTAPIPTPGGGGSKPPAAPPECAMAGRFKGNNPAQYERLASMCRAKGGTPP
ncbi:MAG: serine/threonine-protein kinase [Polyangiaceae bacterium]